MNLKRIVLSFLVLAAAAGTLPARAAVTLKLATMAPEGSIWMNALNKARDEIDAATGGEVKLKLYPGGIMGAEKDVLFKVKMGQLQGGGFMGYGIGQICPDANALMFPMLLRDYAEADAVFAAMRPYLEEKVRAAGWEAMGWTEVGFSYMYGVKPIRNIDQMRATKVWGLDSVMLKELFAKANIVSIPMAITDVLTSLQTGALETVFSPPTAAVAVQWPSRLRYYNTTRLTYAFGGVFLSQAAWKSVPEAFRADVRRILDGACSSLTPLVRKSDTEALEYMRGTGIEAQEATPEEYQGFVAVADAALANIRGKVFSAEAWDRVQAALADTRAAAAP